MLKNKLMKLPSNDANFEIINDKQAASLFGGWTCGSYTGGNCPILVHCGTMSGDCSKLANCGSYINESKND